MLQLLHEFLPRMSHKDTRIESTIRGNRGSSSNNKRKELVFIELTLLYMTEDGTNLEVPSFVATDPPICTADFVIARRSPVSRKVCPSSESKA
jgi:hypothetical protein